MTDTLMGFGTLDNALNEYEYTSQPEALARMLSRENLYIAGGAGSGKSTLINTFIEEMGKTFGSNVQIAVTATTGRAASSIGGRTIHSWSGIGIGVDVKRVPDSVINTDVLIIDEISMLPAYYLDLVDEVCQRAKRNRKPFGGIQVIFSGDFLQLPPVPNRGLSNEFDQRYVIYSDVWQKADIRSCFLDKAMRSVDPTLTRILNDMENGTITQDTVDLLRPRMLSKIEKESGAIDETEKTYTKLYTTNKKVDAINVSELQKLPYIESTYRSSVIKASATEEEFQQFKKTINIPDSISIKPESKVMIIKNGEYPTVNFPFQYDNQEDINNNAKKIYAGYPIFCPNGSVGKVVTILRSHLIANDDLRGAVVVQLNSGQMIAVKQVEETKSKFKTIGKHENGKPIAQKVDILKVSYMPLNLAWAISVHKSQGQTLTGVIADLSQCFVDGMGYVALSRVRALDDLVIEKINKKAFKMNKDSRAINKDVKAEAKENREQFIKDRDSYERILQSEDEDTRLMLWKDVVMGK